MVITRSPANEAILDRFLTSWNYRHAVSKNEGLARATLQDALNLEDPYDVVLIDLPAKPSERTPFAKQLIDDPSHPQPRVIVLSSASDDRGTLLAGIEVESRLNKPVRGAELRRSIEGQPEPIVTGLSFDPSDVDASDTGDGWKTETVFRGRVLLAEDNAINREVCETMLADLGLDVEVAVDGAEAVSRVEQGKYDVILMDCQMPVIDGYEATRMIRDLEESEGLERTPVVALTAHVMAGDREKCLEHGMDDYLGKPFTKATLGAILKNWLQQGVRVGARSGREFSLPAGSVSEITGSATLLDQQKCSGRDSELRV